MCPNPLGNTQTKFLELIQYTKRNGTTSRITKDHVALLFATLFRLAVMALTVTSHLDRGHRIAIRSTS